MAVDISSAIELIEGNKRVFSIGGMWPLAPKKLIFYIMYVCLIIHTVMTAGDLVAVFGDLSLMVQNIFELTPLIMCIVKFMVMRHSSSLKKILRQIHADLNMISYNTEVEKKLYMTYNTIGRMFLRTGSYWTAVFASIFFLLPLQRVLKALLHDEAIPFILPYRKNLLFFEMTNTYLYAVVYICQAPVVYYYYCTSMSFFFLCTLILHVAGELSVLAHRIRNIKLSNWSHVYCDNLEITFPNIVLSHRKIIRMVEEIGIAFGMTLILEILISSSLLGLISYDFLTNWGRLTILEITCYVNFVAIMSAMIYAYCYAGEYLLQLSAEVQYALYECNWYEMSTMYHKDLMICMAMAQKPLKLTAGGFYVISLNRFMSLLKTSMAYVSMLRTVI